MGTPSAARHPLLLCGLLAISLVAAPACGEGEQTEQHWFQVIVNPTEPFSLVVLDGVRVDIDNSLAVEASFGTAAPNLVTVNGLGLDISEGRLRLGDHDFGTLGSTAYAVVDTRGVTVDGDFRGELP